MLQSKIRAAGSVASPGSILAAEERFPENPRPILIAVRLPPDALTKQKPSDSRIAAWSEGFIFAQFAQIIKADKPQELHYLRKRPARSEQLLLTGQASLLQRVVQPQGETFGYAFAQTAWQSQR